MPKAIWINAEDQTIRQVCYDDWRQIQSFVGGLFTPGHYFDDGHCLMVDDEGLLKNLTKGFNLFDAGQTFMGNGLVLGPTDSDGDSLDCRMTQKQIADLTQFFEVSEPVLV